MPGRTINRRTALRSFGLMSIATIGAASAGCADDQAVANSQDDNLGFAGVVLGEPLDKPTLPFTDTTGEPFDFAAQTKDELTLLFFGYTTCPDVCPVTLSIAETALKKLGGKASRTNVVFVGVDTARDTPEKMTQYLEARGAGFIGLNTEADLSELNEALSTMLLPGVTIPAPEPDGSYAVGHPSQVIVFTPDNRAHIMYQFGVTASDWERDLPRLLTFAWPDTTR